MLMTTCHPESSRFAATGRQLVKRGLAETVIQREVANQGVPRAGWSSGQKMFLFHPLFD